MSTTGTRNWVIAAVAALLALHYAAAVCSKLHESTTGDELVHVTGGYSYWALNDYRLQPENGNLPQRWAALPTWLAGAKFPTLDQDYWRVSDAWVMGHEFFYETGEDHFPKLMAGRAMIGLFSVATGLLVFCWSRRLFGLPGAFVSLAFFAFSPSFLAHGGLATSDVCMAFFMLASVGAWWSHLNTPGARGFALSSLVLGLACVAKYSAVLLFPMLAICALAYLWGRPDRTGTVLLSALGHAAVAVAVIWAFYGFRYSAFNPALPAANQFIESWPKIYALSGWEGRVIHFLADIHALPEAFLYGAAYVVQTSQLRAAFLNGEYSVTGWPSYFLWTFAYKSTLPFIVASAWGLWLAIGGRLRAETGHGGRMRELLPLTPLLSLFAVYWIFSVMSHLNIGERHLLPIYPVLFIITGALGVLLGRGSRWPALAVAALITWHVAESAWVAPNYLAYFNELAGGPAGGRNHLVDSSLDWGQDLPGLKLWLDSNTRPGDAVFLSYFGTGNPRYYGIHAKQVEFLNNFHEDSPYVELGPGIYCIGATALELVYNPVRGLWTPELEKEYQFLRTYEPMFKIYAEDPAGRASLERKLPNEKWVAFRDRFQHLRFARLCNYLWVRKPDAVIGYSMFIYRLSSDEVNSATAGSMKDWASLIDRSGDGL